ncbi:uncharacterized protein LOC127586521 [Pristis pectinata]|uniref:uncharacterized protein LOC127586521 n=1 Tax=Pristis pectinata TaxID=685728 RepID=UPI00223CE331|nr:uncharacterized protein LOC127586521 [Pristis pectinata]
MPTGSQGGILVSQSPPYLKVTAGEDVVLHCNFTFQDNVTTAFVEWKREEHKLIDCQIAPVTVCPQQGVENKINFAGNWSAQVSTLHIRNVQLKDNATYYCNLQVEKPTPIRHGCGEGTTLIVTAPEETSADSSRIVCTSLPALLATGIPFCLLCMICILCRGKGLTGLRPESQRNKQGAGHRSQSSEDKLHSLLPNQEKGLDTRPPLPVDLSMPSQLAAGSREEATYSEIRLSEYSLCTGSP